MNSVNLSEQLKDLSRDELIGMLERNTEDIKAHEKENKRLHEGWGTANQKVIELENKLRKATGGS